jgi:hypothetical protein
MAEGDGRRVLFHQLMLVLKVYSTALPLKWNSLLPLDKLRPDIYKENKWRFVHTIRADVYLTK